MNMIEKVARAIAAADEQNGGPPYDMLMTMGKHVRNGLYDRAKAAIEAMREPTPEMLEAALDWHDHVAADETYPMARGVIRAAVGAALDEK